MAYELLGTWHSFRPQPAGDLTDWGEDGTIRIDEIETFSGRIRGTFKDLNEVSVPIQGVATCIGASQYALVIEHVLVLNNKTRHYEGTIVARNENPELFIVAGRFSTLEVSKTERASAISAASDGQEEGIWVATKP